MKGSNSRLKLDLHTHCYEAAGFAKPTVELVGMILGVVKTLGLDGIAITDHSNKIFAQEVRRIAESHFPGEVLIIVGQEIEDWPAEVVELYLPSGLTFRYIAHPGYPGDFMAQLPNVHGIEINNGGHNWHMDRERIREIAAKHDLVLLSNSDAHFLEDIGRFYNEINLEQLEAAVIEKRTKKMEKTD